MTTILHRRLGAQGGFLGPHDHVRCLGRDRLITSWAAVGLHRLWRSDCPNDPASI